MARSPVHATNPLFGGTIAFALQKYFGVSLINARRGAFAVGACLMTTVGFAGVVENAYVATGHSVWGILNAPATGEAMAELIADGTARTTNLSPFDPARLPPLDPARLRQVL